MSDFPNYLLAPGRELWRWADDGETVVWSEMDSAEDDGTAAFARELAVVLAGVRGIVGGLPSLSAVVVTVAATQGRIEDAALHRRLTAWTGGSVRPASVSRVVEGLGRLADGVTGVALGSSGISPLALLIAYRLRDARDWLRSTASGEEDDVIDTLRRDAADRVPLAEAAHPPDVRVAAAMIRRAWQTLTRVTAADFDPEDFAAWVRTGLTDLPADIGHPDVAPELPTLSSLIRSLVDDDDPQVAAASRWAASLSVMLRLPRGLHRSDDPAGGGWADVANRGTPDRLLMTELAAPPDLLMARIASGAALYVRREPPPQPDTQVRPVLIEQSLRCWGSTRVRLAAAALAVGAAEERRGQGKAAFISVDGEGFVADDFRDRRGLIEHLERLSLDRDPGGGLATWAQSERNGGPEEPVLVVSEETRRDRSFERRCGEALGDAGIAVWLTAAVDHDGTLTLRRHGVGGVVEMQRLPAAFDEVVGKCGDPVVTANVQIPKFLTHPDPPLRFPVTAPPRWAVPGMSDDGAAWLWIVTHDNRLLLMDRDGRGGWEVARHVPGGRFHAHRVTGEQLSFVVGPNGETHHWWTVDCDGPVRRREVSAGAGDDYAFVGDRLVRMNGKSLTLLSSDGRVLASEEQLAVHQGEGVFLARDTVQVYGSEGEWFRLHHLTPSPHGESPASLFGRGSVAIRCPPTTRERADPGVMSGDDTVFLLTRDRRWLFNASTRQWIPTKSGRSGSLRDRQSRPEGFMWDADKKNIAFVEGESRKAFRLNPRYGAVQTSQLQGLLCHFLSPDLFRRSVPKPTLSRLTRVCWTSEGLLLVGRRQRCWLLATENGNRFRVRQARAAVAGIDGAAELQRWRPKADINLPERLLRAELPGGVVVLDGRGWLHLMRDDDPRELTLSLSEGPLSGCLDLQADQVFGSGYYHDRCEPNAFDYTADEACRWFDTWCVAFGGRSGE